jgi:hypothetical protein
MTANVNSETLSAPTLFDEQLDQIEYRQIIEDEHYERMTETITEVGGCACMGAMVKVRSLRPIYEGVPGASVNLIDRNYALRQILVNYGIEARAKGMATALLTPPLDRDIINHYGGSFEKAFNISNRGLKRSESQIETTNNLWNVVYGSKGLTDLGIDGRQVLAASREELIIHRDKFYGSANRNARNREAKKLKKLTDVLGKELDS